MVVLSEEQKKKVEAAYWNFQSLKTAAPHTLAMGEREAFVGTVRQLLREMLNVEQGKE